MNTVAPCPWPIAKHFEIHLDYHGDAAAVRAAIHRYEGMRKRGGQQLPNPRQDALLALCESSTTTTPETADLTV